MLLLTDREMGMGEHDRQLDAVHAAAKEQPSRPERGRSCRLSTCFHGAIIVQKAIELVTTGPDWAETEARTSGDWPERRSRQCACGRSERIEVRLAAWVRVKYDPGDRWRVVLLGLTRRPRIVAGGWPRCRLRCWGS
jgi:hypothetical protein